MVSLNVRPGESSSPWLSPPARLSPPLGEWTVARFFALPVPQPRSSSPSGDACSSSARAAASCSFRSRFSRSFSSLRFAAFSADSFLISSSSSSIRALAWTRSCSLSLPRASSFFLSASHCACAAFRSLSIFSSPSFRSRLACFSCAFSSLTSLPMASLVSASNFSDCSSRSCCSFAIFSIFSSIFFMCFSNFLVTFSSSCWSWCCFTLLSATSWAPVSSLPSTAFFPSRSCSFSISC
mmetsp:Transcript_87270/g.151853  ORF Transcript_87270/g.151853 Transcript_87270/m.151853 type:complete len:238 (-) Transcript_87270:436-1149(-)